MTADERVEFLAAEKATRVVREAMLQSQMGIRIAIDMGFESIHTKFEINSLAKQITAAYAHIRKMEHPFALTLVNFTGNQAEALHKLNVDKWRGVATFGGQVFEKFERDEIIYLTPDADEVLQILESNKVYVIGGIVDRSVRKETSIKVAQTHSLRTARLPTKHVLNIDTVIKTLAVFQECQDWSAAMRQSVPLRTQQHPAIKSIVGQNGGKDACEVDDDQGWRWHNVENVSDTSEMR
eukprot:c9547_g1_i2.p1 GENE.c9547_g1_i2~~c9547_g1_i2.p1  ORF type:complete len:238 (-),score=70.55 c9547_g1_i2:24-737(-)